MATIKIITHDGQFHADEVTAISILNYLYPNNVIIRTREQKIIDTADMTLDVGGVYNHEQKKYDHHQVTFTDSFETKSIQASASSSSVETTVVPVIESKQKILLSSVGLIYRHYGKEFITKLIHEDIPAEQKLFSSEEKFNEFYVKTYYNAIVELDANDNGISQYPEYKQIIKPNYYINSDLSSMIAKFNSINIYGDAQTRQFYRAMDYAFQTISVAIKFYYIRTIELEQDMKTISEAIADRFRHSKTGEILVVTKDCSNYLECIKRCEKSTEFKGENIKYIIYPSGIQWRIKTISDRKIMRRPLKSDVELKQRISNPSDLIFVHKALFIGGAKTLESAIEMAQYSLN